MGRLQVDKRVRTRRWDKLRPLVLAWLGDLPKARLSEALGLRDTTIHRWMSFEGIVIPTDKNMDRLEEIMKSDSSILETKCQK